jgi:hypothetical protein
MHALVCRSFSPKMSVPESTTFDGRAQAADLKGFRETVW